MKKTIGLAAAAALALTTVANADVVLDIDDTWGGSFGDIYYGVGDLQGTITSISVDVMWTGGDPFTWASDVGVILVAGNDLINDPYLVQAGGWSDYGAVEWYQNWGGLDDANPAVGTVNLVNAIDASTVMVFVGNLYGASDATSFVGTITLHGASVVPAPGALALLGLAGLAGTTRRRRA